MAERRARIYKLAPLIVGTAGLVAMRYGTRDPKTGALVVPDLFALQSAQWLGELHGTDTGIVLADTADGSITVDEPAGAVTLLIRPERTLPYQDEAPTTIDWQIIWTTNDIPFTVARGTLPLERRITP